MRSEAIAEALIHVPLFAALCPQGLARLAKSSRVRDYRAEAPIVLQGDINSSMFVLVNGCVKVHRSTERGTDVVLAILGADECFGELSFIDGLPRSAAVTALENTKTIELTAEAVHAAVLAEPDLAWSLLKAVSHRLREQNSVVETLVTKDVAGRIADLLVRLAHNHGKQYRGQVFDHVAPESAIVIMLSLTQTDIGTFVGATRERVGKVMAEMRLAKIIGKEPGSGRIVIADHVKLKRISDIG